MSWRFRKTFKLLPGVKLNLTAHGLSATVGAAPFSINVGPKGVYRNVSIPGTGIWDRQRIGGPLLQPSGIQRPATDDAGGPTIPSLPPSIPVSPLPAIEIHSASTELLTSESLEHLRRLLTDAYIERDELTKEISGTTLESNTATRRYQKWERGFFMKRLFKQSFTTRKEAADTAAAKLEELHEQLRLTTIATEIMVDREQAEPYYRMRDEFAASSGCQKVWNVLTEKMIDRIAERSTANTAVTRNLVSFSLDSCDLLQWDQKVPHLQNYTGGDMYIYPGFILYRASRQAFALIDFHDVSLKFISTEFTEADPVPSDTQVIGHTWAKSNKDGTPDRRFANNYQIPVVRYGSLLFSSPDGLDVRYLCSNAALAERFVKSWAAFRISFTSEGRDGSHTATAAQSSDTLKRVKSTHDAYMDAFSRFRTAQDTFLSAMIPQAEGAMAAGAETGKLRLSKETVTIFMRAVRKLIDAAKVYVAATDSSQLWELIDDATARKGSASATHHANFLRAKAIFENAIEGFEIARTQLEKVMGEGRMELNPYVDAMTTFGNAFTQFDETLAAIMDRATKRRKR